MKKLIASALTLTMALTMSVTAFAADTTITQASDSKDGSTSVKFSVDPTYSVTIPEEVQLTYDDGTSSYKKDGVISTGAIRLGKDQNITVTVAGNFKMLSAEGAELAYAVKVGDGNTAIKNGDTVATFGTDTAAQSVTLKYSADDPDYAGNYTDTLTFTISAPTLGTNSGT